MTMSEVGMPGGVGAEARDVPTRPNLQPHSPASFRIHTDHHATIERDHMIAGWMSQLAG